MTTSQIIIGGICGQPMPQERIELFWSKVDKTSNPSGCWTWKGNITNWGYGTFRIVPCGKSIGAHRIAYELTRSTIQPGMLILHSCDNPTCVNPNHLSEGTQADNMRDKTTKGRQAKGEAHGSKTHPEKWVRGTKHHQAKVKAEDVQMIRRDFAAGILDQRGLAKRHGLNQKTVWAMIHRKTWAHVA